MAKIDGRLVFLRGFWFTLAPVTFMTNYRHLHKFAYVSVVTLASLALLIFVIKKSEKFTVQLYIHTKQKALNLSCGAQKSSLAKSTKIQYPGLRSVKRIQIL